MKCGREERSNRLTEKLLGGVHHVEKTVLVFFLVVYLCHGGRKASHALVVDKEIESLSAG